MSKPEDPSTLEKAVHEWTSDNMLKSTEVFKGEDPKIAQSMAIPRKMNVVLRIPDGTMALEQQEQFQDLLYDVYKDPRGFKQHVHTRRAEMEFPANKSPIDCSPSISTADFTQLKAIGEGHFSKVFYCKLVKNNQEYALKRIKISMPSSKVSKPGESNTYGKTLKEVGLLQTLSHNHIIQCYATFFEDAYMYIVLEWAGGGDLKMLIGAAKSRNLTFPEDLIWQYFEQIGSAIQYMHSQRIMHRDLKPSNILLTAGGELKVADFGLGRYLNLQSVMAYTQVGTPLYMSPEILKGQGHTFGSDVWSLGCVIYELTVGTSPFYEKKMTMDKLFWKITNGYYRSLQQNVYYNSQIGELIDRMLSINIDRRITIEVVMQSLLQRKTNGQDTNSFANDTPSPRNSEFETEDHCANSYHFDESESYETEAASLKIDNSLEVESSICDPVKLQDSEETTKGAAEEHKTELFTKTLRLKEDKERMMKSAPHLGLNGLAIPEQRPYRTSMSVDDRPSNSIVDRKTARRGLDSTCSDTALVTMEADLISAQYGNKSQNSKSFASKLPSPIRWMQRIKSQPRIAAEPAKSKETI